MNGGSIWLVFGVFIGAFLVMNNAQAAEWFQQVFSMVDGAIAQN